MLFNPFDTAAEKAGTTAIVYAAILLTLVMAVYAAAFIVRERYDRKASESSADYDGEYMIDDDDDDDSRDWENDD